MYFKIVTHHLNAKIFLNVLFVHFYLPVIRTEGKCGACTILTSIVLLICRFGRMDLKKWFSTPRSSVCWPRDAHDRGHICKSEICCGGVLVCRKCVVFNSEFISINSTLYDAKIKYYWSNCNSVPWFLKNNWNTTALRRP